MGVHGYRHLHYNRLTSRAVSEEIARAKARFLWLGLDPCCFRPPYGTLSASLPGILRRSGLRGVLWSIDSYDWRGLRGRRLLDRIGRYLKPGAIILLHDQSLPLREIEAVIQRIQKEGYRIVPLKDLMAYPSCYP